MSLRLLLEIVFSRPLHRSLLIFSSAFAAFMGLAAAFAQKEFVDALLGQPLLFEGLTSDPLVWLFLGFAALLLNLALLQTVNYIGARESMIMQRRLADRLYQKVLKLQPAQLRGRSVGEVVSIYSTDVPGSTILLEQSMPQGFGILFPLILAPWVLIQMFGLPFSFVASLLGIVVLINLVLAFRQSRFFFMFKKLAADRIGLVNEWIQNIRTLRILSWMNAFEDRIVHVRKVETKNRIRMLTNGQTMNAISSSMTFVINVIVVLYLVKSNPESITPGSLLALLWIVGIFMTRPFRQLPWFFTFVFDGWTSVQRVASYLALEPSEFANLGQSSNNAKESSPALEVKGLSLKAGSVSLLKNINLVADKGEFVAIVGEVGSGKSVLLQSLLGETPAEFQSYRINGQEQKAVDLAELRSHFAYVPQEGFTMSASLFENIAFNYVPREIWSDKDLEKAKKALTLSEFDLDTERIAGGLQTEIGERGVNLSGGQKQRISLARAIYAEAEIMLLDDTFSALDVDTEKKLIDQLFDKAWAFKTRILSTHRLSVLSKADRIYFLKEGQVLDVGTWHEMLQRSPEFNEFVQSVLSQERERQERELKENKKPQKPEESPVTTTDSSEKITEDFE